MGFPVPAHNEVPDPGLNVLNKWLKSVRNVPGTWPAFNDKSSTHVSMPGNFWLDVSLHKFYLVGDGYFVFL